MAPLSDTTEVGQLGPSHGEILGNTGKRCRRERAKNACVACHQRKVKCDLNLNQPCSICTSFNFKCVVREHKKKRVRRSKNAEENLLDPTQLDTIKLNPVDIIEFDTYKTSPLQTGAQNSLLLLPPPPPPSSSPIIETKHLTRKLEENEIKILNLIGSFNLPSSKYSLRLINTYFDKMNPLSPVLEKTYFFQQYISEDNSKLLPPPSLTLLQCVLFCGLMGSIDSNWSEAQMETFRKMLNSLYKRGKSLFDVRIDDNPLEVVQSAILLKWFDYSPIYCPHYVDWNRLGLIIAKENKFHRIKPQVPLNLTDMVNNKQTIVVNRMKLSCWWTLYMRDILASINEGHQFGIDLNVCDIPLPYCQELNRTTDHSQYNIKLQSEFRLNAENYPVRHSTKFLHLVSTKLTNFDKMDLLSFDRLMIQYLKSFLINNSNSTTREAPKASILNLSLFDYTHLLNFNCSILLIHKMSIFKNYSTSSTTSYFPSWKLTFEIAVNIIKIVTFLTASPKHNCNLIPAATTIACSLYASVMLLVYHLHNTDSTVVGITKTYINKSIDLLRLVSIYTTQSTNYLKVINWILSNEHYQHVLIGGLVYSCKKRNGRKISISSLIQSHSNDDSDRNEEFFRNNVYLKKPRNFESIDPNMGFSSTTYESRPDDTIDLNELFFCIPEVSPITDQTQGDIEDVDGCEDYSSTNSSSYTPVLSPSSTGLTSPRLKTPVVSQLPQSNSSSTLATLEDDTYDYDRTGPMLSLEGDGNSQTMTFFDIDQFSLKNHAYDWIPDFKIKPYSELRESLENSENLDSIYGNN